jgi:hypothetical protein
MIDPERMDGIPDPHRYSWSASSTDFPQHTSIGLISRSSTVITLFSSSFDSWDLVMSV